MNLTLHRLNHHLDPWPCRVPGYNLGFGRDIYKLITIDVGTKLFSTLLGQFGKFL
jgi:hypothetical protein